MILYFADRQLNILGHASTVLPEGLTVVADNMIEDVETGVASFECEIPYDRETRADVENFGEVGNYLLRSFDGKNEFYTIIESELDTYKQRLYIYAEDAGMDLLNEVFGEYEADKAYSITHYINLFAAGSGFTIGTNEAKNLTRKLSWDGESTAAERIASVATQFDGCEVSYTFEVKNLTVTKKFINIYKQRGKDIGVQLYLNRDIDSIVTSKSIANLATALQCTGGTPEDSEDPITLKGYSYDDGDFYVDSSGVLKSRTALKQWARYLWKDDDSTESGGHIVKRYSYDTTSQKTLCSRAITELKKIREMEVNYEIDLKRLPENVQIGDRVNIIDDAGGLYLSSRILQLERSVADQKQKAVLGEYLIKSDGISQKVADLAAQFAKQSQSAARALAIAETAKTAATQAKEQVDAAIESVEEAQKAVEEVADVVETARQSAEAAQAAANNAQSVVDGVENRIESLEGSLANAEAAAQQAHQAAATAQTKATEAQQAAVSAEADAEEAKAAASTAQTKAESAELAAAGAKSDAEQAIDKATEASTTAAAAKLDAEAAKNDVDALGDSLTTLSNTMTADYARKTELTETEASLQSQISQNAAQIQTTVSSVTRIDETANNAAEQAQAAQTAAQAAQDQADQATAEATAAQSAADAAAQAAQSAQSEADTAKAAAATAQGVADKAKTDLDAAKADLATVQGRVDATEEEIAAAQAAVNAAQTAADKAQADADTAAGKATEAQTTANTAVTNAANAQAAANEAASKANLAQQTADAAKGDAAAAQAKANEAAATAATAQQTAAQAVANAATAQTKANEAAAAAIAAQAAADDADAKAAQAAADLAAAEQNLASVTSRVGATEEEVAAAQQAVNTAQAAADKAKQDAAAAQSTADTAKANAATAQQAANNAKAAADQAQADAAAAQQAADKAQADVDDLAIRVTAAETKITQTDEQIALTATKVEEVTTKTSKSVKDVKRYYCLSAEAPEKPTEYPPMGGEHTYTLTGDEETCYLSGLTYTRIENLDESCLFYPVTLVWAKTEEETVLGCLSLSGENYRAYSYDSVNPTNPSDIRTGILAIVTDVDNVNINGATIPSAGIWFLAGMGSAAPISGYRFTSVGIEKVLWNGDVTGLESVADMWYKVKSDVPTDFSLVGGFCTITMVIEGLAESESVTLTEEWVWDWSQDQDGSLLCVMADSDSTPYVVVVSKDQTLDGFGDFTTGVYFFRIEEDGAVGYVSVLSGFGSGSGWSETEPAAESGKSLYSTVCTVLNDGTFNYSDVSLSSALDVAEGVKQDLATNYYTKTETHAEITVESDAVRSLVQSSTENLEGQISSAESIMQQLADNIAMLVTDENGTSLMSQVGNKWTYSTADIQASVGNLSTLLEDLTKQYGDTKAVVSFLQQAVSDIGVKTDYVNVGTYTYTNSAGENVTEPCIELGESENEYKVLITNTQILFKVGSNVPTRIDATGLVSENVTVENELRFTNRAASGYYYMQLSEDQRWGVYWKGADA